MPERTIFKPAGKGMVRIKPEFIPDLVALLGIQLKGCQDAIEQSSNIKAPELREQAKGQVRYHKAMQSGLLGVMKRLGLRIDKDKLALSRIRNEDVVKLIIDPTLEVQTLPTLGKDDVTPHLDGGGNPSAGERDSLGADGSGARHRESEVERGSGPARVRKER